MKINHFKVKVKHSGIYLIQINKYNYIGQSVNITARISQHKRKLEKNQHGNKFMQNVFNKHKSFEYKILWKGPKALLYVMEQLHIDMYNKFNLMNLTNATYHSEEHKKKISQSLKSSEKAQASIQNCIKVRMENYTGKSEAQLEISRKCSNWLHTPDVVKKATEAKLSSKEFRKARNKAGKKMIGNQYAKGKTNGIKNGNSDITVYVFQNKKSKEIFVGTRYELADKISKTSYALSNMINGKEKSAFGYILLASPLSK